VRIPFFSMVNLIAERRVVPELIQNDFTPHQVSGEVLKLLRDQGARDAMRAGLSAVRRLLGPPGAIERAADAILELVEARAGNAK
jgi:lipid-A-disaccharide synthase